MTAALLLEAAGRYIDWQVAECKHPTYTKNASTWLNGEHWNDERAVTRPKPSNGDINWDAAFERAKATDARNQETA